MSQLFGLQHRGDGDFDLFSLPIATSLTSQSMRPLHMESYHDSKCSYITKIARQTRYCQDCQLEVIARYLRNLDTA